MRYKLNHPKVIKRISSQVDSLLKKELIEKFPTQDGKIIFYKDEATDGDEYSMLDDCLGIGIYTTSPKESKFDIQFRPLWLDVEKFLTVAQKLWNVSPTDILQNFENIRAYFFKILESVNLAQAISIEMIKHLNIPIEGRFSKIFWNGDSPEWYFSNDLDLQYLFDHIEKAPEDSLIQYINHTDPRVRREACGKMPLGYVPKLMNDEDPRVRIAVAQKVGDSHLQSLMKDANFCVRREVAKRISPRYLHEMKKDEDAQTRLKAYTRLVNLNLI